MTVVGVNFLPEFHFGDDAVQDAFDPCPGRCDRSRLDFVVSEPGLCASAFRR